MTMRTATIALTLALMGGALSTLSAGCAWFTTPVGQPLPGEKPAAPPAAAAPAPAQPGPAAPAAADPAAPAVATPPGQAIVHPPQMAVPAFLDLLRAQGRARGA